MVFVLYLKELAMRWNPEIDAKMPPKMAIFPNRGKESIMFSGLSFHVEMEEKDAKESYEMAQKAHSMWMLMFYSTK